MGSSKLGLGEILASVNNENDLNKSNVIEKIKSKLKEKVVYREWEENEFGINHPFTVQNGYPEAKYDEVTLLYIATAIGATNLVRALLEVKGIDIDYGAKGFLDEFTPLQLAATEGYKEIAELLVEKGADVNKCNKNYSKKEDTPLQLAVKNDHTELVELLAAKAKVDIVDGNKNNLLHYAANHCSEATILTLIMKGVNPWLKNSDRKTPVDIYTSKYPNGPGYLIQMKKAKNRSTIVFYSMLPLGAIIVISTFATDMAAPGIIASTIVAPEILYVIGAIILVFAFIAKYVTSKACEPSAKAAKEVQSLDITNTKEKLFDPTELSDKKEFLVKESEFFSLSDLVKRKKGDFSIELVDPTQLGEKVTLDDVIVSDQVREVAREVCGHIEETTMKLSQAVGYKTPTGYVLHGKPGCGKTLIARAIANEANAKFISVSGPDFMKPYVGDSASYIGALFKKARENAPCIIFIDEIDSVGKRGVDSGHGGVRTSNDVINKLLTELDGLNPREGVIVIAATNHLEYLGEALIRSGRLSEHIDIPLPDKDLREKILNLYLDKGLDKEHVTTEVNVKELANDEKTGGFSGADLKDLVNKAKRCAILRAKKEGIKNDNVWMTITIDDFNSALEDFNEKKLRKPENKQVRSNIIFDCNTCKPFMQSLHTLHA
ncbi:MAG: AAA family ATPase [Rickettsiales bacterium]|jgi:ATP-dependent 26S proteasome regulatory subunit|nr:AAA family ATPase [Rickettsiales bacterium]